MILTYVIILNYNNWQDTLECIESVLKMKSNQVNYKIIVCDNFSSDNSVLKILQWANGEIVIEPKNDYFRYIINPNIIKPIKCSVFDENDLFHNDNSLLLSNTSDLIVIKNLRNYGFSGGNNTGIKLALNDKKCKFIWLLNNDTVVTDNSLNKMIASMTKPGIVGSWLKYYYNPNKTQVYNGSDVIPYIYKIRNRTEKPENCSNEIDLIIGASMLIHRNVFDNIGLLDDNIFMYFDETEFCIRAKKNGYRCYVSDSIIYHKVGASTKDGEGSVFSWYNTYKNKYYVLKKHYGFGFWNIFLLLTLIYNSILSKNNNKKIASRKILFHNFKI